MQSADDVQFRNAERESFLGHGNHLFDSVLKTIAIAFLTGEAAELAGKNTVVGVVKVTINNIAGTIASFLLTADVGQTTHGIEVGAPIKAQGFVCLKSTAGFDLLGKISQLALLEDKFCH
jgi:hypothetical protein